MKNLIKILSLFLPVLFFSCSEDDPATPADTSKPVITVISPTDVTKPLRATVTVRAEATDDSGIAKVEVFVDGTSIASATSSPVEASWDTKAVTDGSHQIKIVAEDAEGNTEEKTIAVEVKNVLFTFEVANNYLDNYTGGWLYISNSDGSELATAEIIEGETLVFETPEGYDSEMTYAFTYLLYNESGFEPDLSYSHTLVTYLNVPSLNLKLDEGETNSPAVVGKHTLFVYNSPSTNFFTGVASLDATSGFYSGSIPALTPSVNHATANLLQSPADLIYYMVEQENDAIPVYVLIEDAVAGDTQEFDFDNMIDLPSTTISLPEVAINTRYSLNYFADPGINEDSEHLFQQEKSGDTDELKYYYPPVDFEEFYTTLGYETDEASYSYTKFGDLPEYFVKLEANTTSLSVEDNKVSINTTGDHDYVTISGFAFDDITFVDHAILMPGGSSFEGSIPSLPTELLEKFPDLASFELEFDRSFLHESPNVDGFVEWVKLRFSGSSVFLVARERLSKIQSFGSSGGRVGNLKKAKYSGEVSLPLELQDIRN